MPNAGLCNDLMQIVLIGLKSGNFGQNWMNAMNWLRFTQTSPPSSAHLGSRPVKRWLCDKISQFSSGLHAGVGVMIVLCLFSSWIAAQQSEESEQVDDPCEIEIAPIDKRQLTTDPEKTKARIIARMLLDMDRCIGVQRAGIASAKQGSTQGTQSGTTPANNASLSSSSEQASDSTQTSTQENQASTEDALSNTDLASTTKVEPPNTTLTDILRNVPTTSTTIQHNTTLLDLGSDDELVLDDYAKTLHEAYLAETDPVLKEALGKELTNYLNNQKR